MSGIKERIASRRRGSLNSQGGPTAENGHAHNGGGDTASEEQAPASSHLPAPASAHAPASAPAPASAHSPASAPTPLAEPDFLARGRMRRRLRYLRRLREIQLRDIGGFVLELHRFGRERPDLVQAKVAWAAQTDAEVRALERALQEDHPMRELREPGIGGACQNCGAVHGSQDHFCATCGEPLPSDQATDDPSLGADHPGEVR